MEAFSEVDFPGDDNLRNSSDGTEPYLLAAEFKGNKDWVELSATFLDQAPGGFAHALSFFSAEAFRFYLSAYLLADLSGKLKRADPIFDLTHGLTNATKGAFVNPRRYGKPTWFEYVSDRYSVFTPKEAKAIISYLEFKLERTNLESERDLIGQSINNYWKSRSVWDKAY